MCWASPFVSIPPPQPDPSIQSTPHSAIFLVFSAAERVFEKHAPSDRTCHFEHVTFHFIYAWRHLSTFCLHLHEMKKALWKQSGLRLSFHFRNWFRILMKFKWECLANHINKSRTLSFRLYSRFWMKEANIIRKACGTDILHLFHFISTSWVKLRRIEHPVTRGILHVRLRVIWNLSSIWTKYRKKIILSSM
jgi:hypothetical protein